MECSHWSPHLARRHYCQQVTLSAPLSGCLSFCHAPSNCFFFFVSRWNRAIFWPSVLHVALYETLFFDFWFRPPNAQNLLPKICTKSPISRLVWQIDWRCLDLPGGFRWWPIQWNHAKCCGTAPCCHGNEICARRGDPDAYRLVKLFVCLCRGLCDGKTAPRSCNIHNSMLHRRWTEIESSVCWGLVLLTYYFLLSASRSDLSIQSFCNISIMIWVLQIPKDYFLVKQNHVAYGLVSL